MKNKVRRSSKKLPVRRRDCGVSAFPLHPAATARRPPTGFFQFQPARRVGIAANETPLREVQFVSTGC